MAIDEFELDPTLAKDSILIGTTGLCQLRLINDANYPWFILVPRVAGVEEIYQLSEEQQLQLLQESSYLAEVLKDLFAASKMNVAALGNIVRQLHLHVVARYEDDAAWPAPVWGKKKAIAYKDEQVEDIIARLKLVINEGFEFV